MFINLIPAFNVKWRVIYRQERTNERRIHNAIKSPFLSNKDVPKDVQTQVIKPIMTWKRIMTPEHERKSRLISTEIEHILEEEDAKTRTDKIRNNVFRVNLKILFVEISIHS